MPIAVVVQCDENGVADLRRGFLVATADQRQRRNRIVVEKGNAAKLIDRCRRIAGDEHRARAARGNLLAENIARRRRRNRKSRPQHQQQEREFAHRYLAAARTAFASAASFAICAFNASSPSSFASGRR
jgi:hypothetical protein